MRGWVMFPFFMMVMIWDVLLSWGVGGFSFVCGRRVYQVFFLARRLDAYEMNEMNLTMS